MAIVIGKRFRDSTLKLYVIALLHKRTKIQSANYVHVSLPENLRQRRLPATAWPFISGTSSGTTTSVELLLLVLHDLSSINLNNNERHLGF